MKKLILILAILFVGCSLPEARYVEHIKVVKYKQNLDRPYVLWYEDGTDSKVGYGMFMDTKVKDTLYFNCEENKIFHPYNCYLMKRENGN